MMPGIIFVVLSSRRGKRPEVASTVFTHEQDAHATEFFLWRAQ